MSDPLTYHQATKHTVESIYRSQHTLDWDNMPDPFRHYERVPVVDLPADPEPPEVPALEVLRGGAGAPSGGGDGADFLSRLLFYSASISASKVVPSTGYRYALRVNPSSGNLHPTEFHFLTRGLAGWEDGLYHYRVSSHMAELRARGAVLPDVLPDDPVVFLLSTIAWREAWKYQNRAYRYCLHDTGHAWQALALAARAMGCQVRAVGEFPDDEVATKCRLADDEWPTLFVGIRGPGVPVVVKREGGGVEWLGGTPNSLSADVVAYPLIDSVHEATKMGRWRRVEWDQSTEERRGNVLLPEPSQSQRSFGETARRRRSALDFVGGVRSIGLDDLSAMLDAARRPLECDFEARLTHLYAWVHRVRGLQPGVYRYWPHAHSLQLVRPGDHRVAAAGLSLGQDLAGNACVAFSMIADLQRAAGLFGNRGYRYCFFEAGAIGQRFYLAAESLGFQSTGIGAFYDDQVHHYLDIEPAEGQVVYHFASGFAVHDPRLDARQPFG